MAKGGCAWLGHAWQGACVAGGGSCVVGGGDGGMRGGRDCRGPLLQGTVRILLECIVVVSLFTLGQTEILPLSFTTNDLNSTSTLKTHKTLHIVSFNVNEA